MLRLRALRISGDLDEYWRFHEAQEHLLNYEMAYAEAVPTVLHSKRPGAAESTARSSKKPHPAHLTLVP